MGGPTIIEGIRRTGRHRSSVLRVILKKAYDLIGKNEGDRLGFGFKDKLREQVGSFSRVDSL